MVSAHFTHRDQRGLPVLTLVRRRGGGDSLCSEEISAIERWNEVQRHLRSITSNIRGLEERIEFVEHWVLRNLKRRGHSPIHHEATQTVNQGTDNLLENEIAGLEGRERSTSIKWLEISAAVEVLIRHALSSILDSFPIQPNPFEQPWTFMRHYHDNSHTQYSGLLGFQGSGWTACEPANSFTELKEKGVLTAQSIRSHCERAKSPSHWISLCDDASWMLKYVSKTIEGNIAIISVPKMDRINVLWDRSDVLVLQTGENCTVPNILTVFNLPGLDIT